jgi:RNA polymerase sigma-70 factor (ECF subfamily)
MGRLLEAFQAARGLSSDEAGSVDELSEGTLTDLYGRGRAAHPDLNLEDAVFSGHLGRCRADLAAAGGLHVEDLYLACACLQGDARAISQARVTLQPSLRRYLAQVAEAAASFDEIEQRLWDSLLVGASSVPKLASYSGVGPLASWIGVTAQRIALMMFRHERAETRARDEAAAQETLLPSDPELAIIKERFRDDFQRAVESALGVLDDRDKALYRLHLVDGLTLERIGKAYGVSTSTIFRWLESARARVLDEARRRLREALDISSGEFESIARLLMSQLDVSLSRVLGKTG